MHLCLWVLQDDIVVDLDEILNGFLVILLMNINIIMQIFILEFIYLSKQSLEGSEAEVMLKEEYSARFKQI